MQEEYTDMCMESSYMITQEELMSTQTVRKVRLPYITRNYVVKVMQPKKVHI